MGRTILIFLSLYGFCSFSFDMDEELEEKKRLREQWNNCIRVINDQARTISGEPNEHNEPIGKPIEDDPWECYQPFRTNVKRTEELQEMLQQEEMSINSTMACRRCKQNTVKTQTIQDRSLDEGMSTIASCVNCKYKWKESS